MMWCTTYFLAFPIQGAFFLLSSFLSPQKGLFLGLIIGHLNFVSTLLLYNGDLWTKATIDLPSQGWFSDYICCVGLLIFTYGEISLTTLLRICFHPVSILDRWISTSTERNLVSFKMYISLGIYGALCLAQLIHWVPLVLQWNQTHCFLDGFMCAGNEINTYIMYTIIIIDYMFVHHLRQQVSMNHWGRLFLILLAFYNMSLALGLYFMYQVLYSKNEELRPEIN